MDARLIPLLRCASCFNGDLEPVGDVQKTARLIEGCLRCPRCGERFPIHDGVLDMVVRDTSPGEPADLRRQTGQWFMEQNWFSRTYEHLLRPVLIGSLAGSTDWFSRETLFLRNAHRVAGHEFLLDAACGPGHFTRLLARSSSAIQIVGVDISAPMLAQHTRRNRQEGLEQRISLVRADVSNLPFVDRVFGGVNCFTAFHLFLDLERSVSELSRILRSGGRFTAMVLTRPESQFQRIMVKFGEQVAHLRFFPPEEVRRIFWRNRMATVDLVEEGMVALYKAVLSEQSRKLYAAS